MLTSKRKLVLTFIIALVPLGEAAEAFTQRSGGLEAEVLFERGGVGVGDGDITGLHGNKLLVGLEVVVFGKDSCTDEFFLKDGDEIEQVLGTVVADVIYFIRRDGKTIFSVFFFRGMLHHSDDSFHNIIDVGEVAFAVSIVEYLDDVALHQLVGKAEVCHVGTASRTIDGEEAETCTRNVVELAVGMCHQFVALLGGGIEGHGIIHLIIGGIRHFLVGAIDTATAGIHEMRHFVMTAGFKNVVEADEVGLDIGIGVGDAVADTCLCGKVYYNVYLVFGEDLVDEGLVGDVAFDERPGVFRGT